MSLRDCRGAEPGGALTCAAAMEALARALVNHRVSASEGYAICDADQDGKVRLKACSVLFCSVLFDL